MIKLRDISYQLRLAMHWKAGRNLPDNGHYLSRSRSSVIPTTAGTYFNPGCNASLGLPIVAFKSIDGKDVEPSFVVLPERLATTYVDAVMVEEYHKLGWFWKTLGRVFSQLPTVVIYLKLCLGCDPLELAKKRADAPKLDNAGFEAAAFALPQWLYLTKRDDDYADEHVRSNVATDSSLPMSPAGRTSPSDANLIASLKAAYEKKVNIEAGNAERTDPCGPDSKPEAPGQA